MNPKLCMNGVYSLHVQPIGFQFFILILNSAKDFGFLIDSGRSSHVFCPRNNNVSVQNPSVLTLYVCEHLWPLRL